MTSVSSEKKRSEGREMMPGAAFPYGRILVTFADLPQVEEVFQLALHLAAGPDRELFLLRVVPGGRERGGPPADEQSLYSEMRAINTLLRTEAIPAQLEAAPARRAETIVAYAEEREVDLIIAVGRATDGGRYRQLVEDLLPMASCPAMILCTALPAAEGKEAGSATGGNPAGAPWSPGEEAEGSRAAPRAIIA